MKKYSVIILILLYSIVFAQENYKGEVSLVFNKEKIELPITVVSLRKENNVFISIRAEFSNDKKHQLILLEWEFEKLSTNDEDLNVYDTFLLNVANNSDNKKDELRFQMKYNAENSELFVKKGNKTWELTSMSMKFNIENISFENSAINIKGNLNFKARDSKSDTPMQPISEIEDCKFKIVI